MNENPTGQNGKKITKKTSRIFIGLGIAAIIIGIIMIIIGAKIEKEATARWWYGYGDMPDFSDSLLLVLGCFVAFDGLPLIFIGLTPYIAKVEAKLKSETLDYAGEDISDAGMKTVDVVKPVVEKGFDEVIVPNIAKLKNSAEKVQKCPNCGDEIEEDEVFCSSCGMRLKKTCSSCGTVNSAGNQYCKKCGNRFDE